MMLASIPKIRKAFKLWLIVSLVAISLAFGSCQTSSSVSTIRIGLIVSLSGDIPEVGQATINAAQMAMESVNAAGGLPVNGRQQKIELIINDSPDNPQGAVASAQKLINQENVAVIVGPQASRNAIPAAEVAEATQIPLISPWSTNPKTTLGKRYVFRVPFTDPAAAQAMAKLARVDLEVQKAAILYDVTQPHNTTSAEVFQQAFESLGGQIVANEVYTPDTADLKPLLQKIQANQPQVLYLPNYANEIPLQASLVRELGIDATLLGTDAWATIAASELSESLEGSLFTSHYAPDILATEAQDFVEHYDEQYGEIPNDVAALTYDAFGLLFKAISTQQKSDPEAIREGLAAIEGYRGVTGTIGYQQGGDPIKSIVIMKVQDGQFKFERLADPT
ncbi:MAG: ABC transporter substrate-binding protein [Cyanobacteria bacterium P01_F01_bin.86]